MIFFVKNIYRTILTHWKANLLILADLILCALMIFIMLQNYSFAAYEFGRYYGDEGLALTYTITSEYDRTQDIPFYKQSPMYEATKLVKEEIQNSEFWKPYYFVWLSLPRSIFVSELPEDFELQYDPKYPQPGFSDINSILFSKHLMAIQNITIFEGREFIAEDHELSAETVSLILGYDFLPFYDVGDIIIYDGQSAKVVGFLTDNAFLRVFDGDYYNLDRSVILPRMFSHDASTTSDPELFLLLDGGNLAVNNPQTDVQAEINKITAKYGWFPIRCEPIDGSRYINTEVVTQKNIALLLFLAIISSLLCLTALSNILFKRTIKEYSTHCTFLLSGTPLWKINLSIIIEMAFWTGLAIVPVIALSYLEYGRMLVSPLYILGFMGMIVAISLIPVIILNGKSNLDLFMRSRSE